MLDFAGGQSQSALEVEVKHCAVRTAALLGFRREGDTVTSRRLLAKARAGNAFVPDYLLGKRKMPARLPAFMGVGDEDEAIHFMDAFATGWRETPGALDWLRRTLSGRRAT